MACSSDADCQNGPPGTNFVCACPDHVQATGTDQTQTCVMPPGGSCDPSVGRCVRQDCRDLIATYHEAACAGSPQIKQCDSNLDACALAGEECKLLSCVDHGVGAFTDARIQMVGR